VIACNDDALKSIKLIVQAISDVVIDKKGELNIAIGQEEKKEAEPKIDVKEALEAKNEGEA
jgi:small subunit ribosomal protein S2